MRYLLLISILLCSALPAHAAAPFSTANAEPVTISAKKSLEWDRKKKTYTARQAVVAQQGAAEIHSDTLTAHYTDDDGADIKTLEAAGNVSILSPPYTAYGDKLVYEVATGHAVLTGSSLRAKTGDDVLTARDRIEFLTGDNKLTARGDALVIHNDKALGADTLNAFFAKDKNGKTTAQSMTAEGNVTIKTATETATADHGIYDVASQKAVLTGKVRIQQGKNGLEGTRADVDMVTGISRLSGGDNAATGGRVTGTFYPSAKKDTKETPTP